MRLFEGYEAEGRFRGVKTLFVAGNVPYDIIAPSLKATETGYGQVYFGADKCSEINWLTLQDCFNLVPIVSAEFGSILPPLCVVSNDRFHMILNVQQCNPKKLKEFLENIPAGAFHRIQVKFDSTTKSYLGPYSVFQSNWQTDIINDVELWRQ